MVPSVQRVPVVADGHCGHMIDVQRVGCQSRCPLDSPTAGIQSADVTVEGGHVAHTDVQSRGVGAHERICCQKPH